MVGFIGGRRQLSWFVGDICLFGHLHGGIGLSVVSWVMAD